MIPSEIAEATLLNIRNTLALYSVALDTKNYHLLEKVFAADVECDYSAVTPHYPTITGLATFLDRIDKVLKDKKTQHALSTQTLDFEDDGKICVAMTYFTANTFSEREDGKLEHVSVFGWYDDRLLRGRDGEWRIKKRKVNTFVSFVLLCNLTPFDMVLISF